MTDERIIAVFGATGSQGGGVLRALSKRGKFKVRALTRNPAKHEGLGDEVARADLDAPETLSAALEGAHGVFLVTNFWEGGGGKIDEIGQGRAAVEAAKAAGVKHLVWSTLPDVEAISEGAFDVPHFTDKAKVDAIVAEAGFAHHTFVVAPFYYQNLTSMLGPQPLGDGTKGWAVPIDPDARCVHMGDVTELGSVVAGAFEQPEKTGDGTYLAHVGTTTSWSGIADVYRDVGWSDIAVRQIPADAYAKLYPGAEEMQQMMAYWEKHSYMGPNAEKWIAAADDARVAPATDFAAWAAKNLPPPG